MCAAVVCLLDMFEVCLSRGGRKFMAIEITSAHLPRPLPRHSREVRAEVERAQRRRLLLRAALITPAVALIAVITTLVYCYQSAAHTINARLANGYLTSRAGIYATPRILRAGQRITPARLVETLRRAGYVESAASDVWNGAFTIKDDGVEIMPRRGANVPDVVAVSFDRRGRIREIAGDGVTLDTFALEAEALTNDADMKTGRRTTLSYDELPPTLVHAILAIEDRRFFAHNGIDPTGVGRALLSWTGLKRTDELERQGGSTITQQLVKNTYLTPERTLRRKFNEALLAAALERRLSKQDILALYCNEVYLGQRGAIAVRGVAAGARVYFNKDLKELTVAESATLAGLIQSPARYAPERHPAQAQARRNLVLAAMLRDGAITNTEANVASNTPLAVAPLGQSTATLAPYFIDYVNRLMDARLQEDAHADERSLRVQTTLDLDLQQIAEETVAQQLARLDKIYKGKRTPQAALVALDPQTGHVLAMVGGRDYAATQLNRATDARRQPGSVFKPFVYAAAFEAGVSPAMMVLDAPREFAYDRRAVYRPANYGSAYTMRTVTARTGLVHSLNVVTVDLALRTGLERVASLAARAGLPRPAPYPALALGTTEATPLEVASAYTAFANNGTRTAASAITRAVDGDGKELRADVLPFAEQVVRPSTAYMITDALTDVINDGTARAARDVQRLTAVAGKTGTSRDGWFAGYTPNLVCVVWIGFDDNKELGLTGAASALPVWQEFITRAVAQRPELGGENFTRPDSITTVEIDPDTGLLASPYCPHPQRLAVTPALAPTAECYLHQAPLQLLTLAEAQDLAAGPQGERSATDYKVAPADGRARDAVASAATRVEISPTGRRRLMNDVQLVVPASAPPR